MISVCIATYNGEKYIREQIDSILPQLNAEDEVIISDDGSTDATLSILHSYKDKRIRIIEGAHRQSPIWNFEASLQQAKGNYIFLADQDDVWKPNKVTTCMKWLKQYDCVISNAAVTDEHLNILFPSLYKLLDIRKNKVYNTLWKNGYTGCCMAFTQRVKDAALPFPKDIPMHDIWIGNVAAFTYSVKFIDDILILFRRHSDTNSCNGKGSKFSKWQQIKFRWNIIKNLLKIK